MKQPRQVASKRCLSSSLAAQGRVHMPTDTILPLILPSLLLVSLYYPPKITINATLPSSLLFPSILSFCPDLLTLHLLQNPNANSNIYRTSNTCLQIYILSRLHAIQGFLEFQTILFRFAYWLGESIELSRSGIGRFNTLIWKHNQGGILYWDIPPEMGHLDFSRSDGWTWATALSVYLISWRLSLVYPVLPWVEQGVGIPTPADVTTLLGLTTGLWSFMMELEDLAALFSEYVN
jgi:hypothetical protein